MSPVPAASRRASHHMYNSPASAATSSAPCHTPVYCRNSPRPSPPRLSTSKHGAGQTTGRSALARPPYSAIPTGATGRCSYRRRPSRRVSHCRISSSGGGRPTSTGTTRLPCRRHHQPRRQLQQQHHQQQQKQLHCYQPSRLPMGTPPQTHRRHPPGPVEREPGWYSPSSLLLWLSASRLHASANDRERAEL